MKKSNHGNTLAAGASNGMSVVGGVMDGVAFEQSISWMLLHRH
jgi:hypothetical protein